MIIKFSVSNFRSIKEAQTLYLEASSVKQKQQNTFLPTNKLTLLKSVAVYGANASGKSNVIKALSNFIDFILNSTDLKNGENIKWYQAFRLDDKYKNASTKYSIQFIANDNIRYKYNIEYNQFEIIQETLDFFPKGYKANIFTRNKTKSIKFAKSFIDKRIDKKILPNQLFLSKSGNSGHKQMGNIYLYFRTYTVHFNSGKQSQIKLKKTIESLFLNSNNKTYQKKLNNLIRVADTKIDSIIVRNDNKGNETNENYITQTVHKRYGDSENPENEYFDLSEESEGTQALFSIGGLILKQLLTGGILILDELENSLHPKLCKFLVKLFHNTESNPKNAQLIFATHEVSLLDKRIFRKDQVWFTEKNKYGETELFSLDDFEEVKDDTPFDLWYMKGKFGGQPNIKEIDFIFGDD